MSLLLGAGDRAGGPRRKTVVHASRPIGIRPRSATRSANARDHRTTSGLFRSVSAWGATVVDDRLSTRDGRVGEVEREEQREWD